MFIITFSHIANGERVPLIENGRAVIMNVQADSKSAAMYDPEVTNFCTNQGNDCRVRGVM
jgi:hypothetical protein